MSGSLGGRVQHSRAAPIAIPPHVVTAATTDPVACITESFNKADGSLGPDLTWVTLTGSPKVASNAFTTDLDAGGVARADFELPASDMTVQAELAVATGDGWSVALLGRLSDDAWASVSGYELNVGPTTAPNAHYVLFKYVAGTLTQIADVVHLRPAVGQVLTLSVVGTAIAGLLDGVSIVSTSDSSVTTGAYAGLGLDVLTGSTCSTDNFEACSA